MSHYGHTSGLNVFIHIGTALVTLFITKLSHYIFDLTFICDHIIIFI